LRVDRKGGFDLILPFLTRETTWEIIWNRTFGKKWLKTRHFQDIQVVCICTSIRGKEKKQLLAQSSSGKVASGVSQIREKTQSGMGKSY
jgi:hypothetical protein